MGGRRNPHGMLRERGHSDTEQPEKGGASNMFNEDYAADKKRHIVTLCQNPQTAPALTTIVFPPGK